jgi:hypothetical protein
MGPPGKILGMEKELQKGSSDDNDADNGHIDAKGGESGRDVRLNGAQSLIHILLDFAENLPQQNKVHGGENHQNCKNDGFQHGIPPE